MNRQAYPLHWPDHWSRTARPKGSQFKTPLSKAMENVEGSLRRFSSDSGKKVDNILISSNFSLGDRKPADSGVAVYFSWDGIETCICVDRYIKIEENLQAIHHCIEAERTKLRHGGLNLVRAAFRGYAALPPPRSNKTPWHEILEVSPGAGALEVKQSYMRLRSKHHPDKQGDPAQFQRVQIAYEEYQRQ